MDTENAGQFIEFLAPLFARIFALEDITLNDADKMAYDAIMKKHWIEILTGTSKRMHEQDGEDILGSIGL